MVLLDISAFLQFPLEHCLWSFMHVSSDTKPVTYELCYLEIKISYMKGELQIEIFSIEQSVLNLRTFLLFPKAFCLFPCPDYKYVKGSSYVSHLIPRQLVPYLAYLALSLFA